jgi:hypothetical protein
LGAIGILVPELAGVLRWLTPVVALGMAILMAGAIPTHLRRKEPRLLRSTIALIGRAFDSPA